MGNKITDPGHTVLQWGHILHPQKEQLQKEQLPSLQAAEGLGATGTTHHTPPPPKAVLRGGATWPEKDISPIHVSPYIVCSFVLSLTLPFPLFFSVCLQVSFFVPCLTNFHSVSCDRHSARSLLLCRHLLCLVTHFRPPVLFPFVGYENVDTDISNISSVPKYEVFKLWY
jgi:hypothetical protein